jgi:hypothetical protein
VTAELNIAVQYRWKEDDTVTGDKGHFMLMEKLQKKATDLGAKIPDAQFKRILINSFPSNSIWATGKVIAYKAATISEAVVDLTNTYLSYYSSNVSTSTTVPTSTTKPVYDVMALLAKINDFMKCNDSHEKVVCENKPYCSKKDLVTQRRSVSCTGEDLQGSIQTGGKVHKTSISTPTNVRIPMRAVQPPRV